MLSATLLCLHLAFRGQGGPTLFPEPWNLQPKLLGSLCLSARGASSHSEGPGVFRCLSISSPSVRCMGSSVTCQWPTAAHQSCCYLFICLLFLFSVSARVVIQHAFAPTLRRTQYLLHLFSLQMSREMPLIIYEAPRPLRGSAHLSAETLHCGWL